MITGKDILTGIKIINKYSETPNYERFTWFEGGVRYGEFTGHLMTKKDLLKMVKTGWFNEGGFWCISC